MSKTAKNRPSNTSMDNLVIPLEDDPDVPGAYKLLGTLQFEDSVTRQVVREVPLHTPHQGPPPPLPIPSNRYRYDSFVVNDFSSWPKLQWMVHGLFHVGSLVMVWGASGAGKTAWLIDLVMSIATGKDWAGRKVERNHILFCAMEGAQGFRERVVAAASHHKFTPDWELRFIFEPVDLTDLDRVNGLAAIADRYSIKLVVIDTLAAALAGKVDENSNQQMAAIIDNAKRLSQMTGATVLLTHHTGHDTRNERGATALRGGVDTSISINRRDKRRHWRVVKQRDGDEGFGGYFELLPSQYRGPDGTVVNSVIAQPGEAFSAEEAPNGSRRKKTGSKQKPEGAASRAGTPSVKGATPLQQKILAQLTELWKSKTIGRTPQEIASASFSMAEALQSCREVSTYNTRDVKRALVRYQKLGQLEQLADDRFRLLSAD